jgi:general secretion pathway protein K
MRGQARIQRRRHAQHLFDLRDALQRGIGCAVGPPGGGISRILGAADAPLESVAEVEQVLGMTPALYARLAPHVTVYSGRERPDPAFASAEVLSAMGFDATRVLAQRRAWTPGTGRPPPLLPDGQPLVGDDSGTYSIDSRARLRGRTAVLRVVVRSGGNGLPGSAWTPLRWEEGASSR